jgi:DNA-binding response OmpR family regulator
VAAHRIVVVDDDRAVRDLAGRYLKPPLFDLYAFAQAGEALARLPAIEPALIVSDIMMPDMDGREFFRRVRADPAMLVVPFIFLTAVRSAHQIAELRAAGAEDYLVKPFPMVQLVEKIRSLLGPDHDEGLLDGASAAAARPEPGAGRYDVRLPRGRFSTVSFEGRSLQVLTEVQAGPSFTVVTVVAQAGRGVCRIATTWRNPLRRAADFALAARQLDCEHERTIRSLPELLAEGSPRRQVWSAGAGASAARKKPGA